MPRQLQEGLDLRVEGSQLLTPESPAHTHLPADKAPQSFPYLFTSQNHPHTSQEPTLTATHANALCVSQSVLSEHVHGDWAVVGPLRAAAPHPAVDTAPGGAGAPLTRNGGCDGEDGTRK